MSKKSIESTFSFPLSHKVVRNLRIITEHVGDLEISGKFYFDPEEYEWEQFDCDIDTIKWNGVDIKPVLEVTGGIEEIQEAGDKHAAYLFADLKVQNEN